jgi:hypothetical protein
VPLFLNVLRLAVQLAAMDYTSGGAGAHSVGPAEAASIAADAAECLLGVAVASSLGREVAVQSGTGSLRFPRGYAHTLRLCGSRVYV